MCSEIIADCSNGGTGVELDVEDRVINDNTLDEDEANTASSWSAGEPDLPDSVLTEREFLRLFVKMNTLLHVPRYAVQEIISGLSHINKLSKGGEFNMFWFHFYSWFQTLNLDFSEFCHGIQQSGYLDSTASLERYL